MVTGHPLHRTALVVTLCLAACAGCARRPAVRVAPPTAVGAPPEAVQYHEVARQETLWRISQRYGVDVPTLMRANHLTDAAHLAVGQRLIIPSLPMVPFLQPTIPLYPLPGRWKYIVIHHSATDSGNASFLNRVHQRRGFINGLGYHFVIDNGTLGNRGGEIEIGPRWLQQADGAHCNAGGMNHVGIGICLVGNFSHEQVSDAQLDSLVQLVTLLRRHYQIPVSRVIRHRDVRGKATECPGNNFPWREFKRRLSGVETAAVQ